MQSYEISNKTDYFTLIPSIIDRDFPMAISHQQLHSKGLYDGQLISLFRIQVQAL